MALLRVVSEASLAPAVELLARQPLWGLELDAGARLGQAPAFLALACEQERLAVALEALPPSSRATLGQALARTALVAWQAKDVCRALQRAGLDDPAQRFGDPELAELLLAGGRACPSDPHGLAARHGIPAAAASGDGYADALEAAALTARLFLLQAERLEGDGLAQVMLIESALIPVLAGIEQVGLAFDAGAWSRQRAALERRLVELTAQVSGWLAGAAGYDGPRELPATLDDAAWPRIARGLGVELGGVSKESLERLPAGLREPAQELRRLQRLLGQHGPSFVEQVGADGRIHASFSALGAATGRLACARPNLQAISADDELRRCFAVPSDRSLVSADYGAAELRILAQLSGEPLFIAAFAAGDDLHARVASEVFGVPVSAGERPELRQRAKVINFGLAYGMGAHGLSRAADLPLDEARALLDRYQRRLPRLFDYLERSAQQAIARGYALTLAGRRRYLDGLDEASAQRVARNTPVQGTGADIIKIALVRVAEALRRRCPGASIVNTVHDEIVVECPSLQAEAVAALLGEEMRAAGASLLPDVPLVVTTAINQYWG